MDNIKENKQGFELFYEQAEKSKLAQVSPQRKFQFQYYDSFIKPKTDRKKRNAT